MSDTIQLDDFVGFKFNGVHSSTLGIVRTSNGSRFEHTTVPTFKDTAQQMPGSDSTLYWESFYSQRTWSIPIAFDSMSEVQFRQFSQTFNGKTMGELIFDELPFKAYLAKVQSAPQLKFICFEENGQRVYKGEGTIQFISYYPFAHSLVKFLDRQNPTYSNQSEWLAASRILDQSTPPTQSGTEIDIYNCGDINMDFIAYYNRDALPTYINLLSGSLSTLSRMEFTWPTDTSTLDTYIRINTRTHLIEGYATLNTLGGNVATGKLYNQYLKSGDFFTIPVNISMESPFYVTSDASCAWLEYSYLYF